MRNRDKPLREFGLTKQEALQFYNHEARHLDPAEQARLADIARKACPDETIARQVFISLTTGQSYMELYMAEFVPIGGGDFYGYRRKVTAVFLGACILDSKGRAHTVPRG